MQVSLLLRLGVPRLQQVRVRLLVLLVGKVLLHLGGRTRAGLLLLLQLPLQLLNVQVIWVRGWGHLSVWVALPRTMLLQELVLVLLVALLLVALLLVVLMLVVLMLVVLLLVILMVLVLVFYYVMLLL